MVTMIEIIRTNAKIANGISVIWSILSAGARRSMRGGDGKRRRGECQGGGRIFEARSRSRLVRHGLRPCVFQLRRRGPRLHRARCSTLVDRQLDGVQRQAREELAPWIDRKHTRLNSS